MEICAARNNNVQLQTSAKANQRGYFDELKNLLQKYNPSVCRQVEWKTNDGGKIKVQDIIALAWIPLSFMTNVKDVNGRSIEPVSPNKIYGAKGSCMAQFEKLMSSTQVTFETTNDYRRELSNTEVATALPLQHSYQNCMTIFTRNSLNTIIPQVENIKLLLQLRK